MIAQREMGALPGQAGVHAGGTTLRIGQRDPEALLWSWTEGLPADPAAQWVTTSQP
jgi:hypothetical protein